MSYLDTKTLKPGDQVGMRHAYSHNVTLETVKKVSASGQVVLENGTRFINGRHRVSDWRSSYLLGLEEATDEIAAGKDRRAAQALHAALVAAVERAVPHRATDVFSNPETRAKIVGELRALADSVERGDHAAIKLVAHAHEYPVEGHVRLPEDQRPTCLHCSQVRSY